MGLCSSKTTVLQSDSLRQVVHASGSSDMNDPPGDLLAAVLQHIEQCPRLCCCALVSKAWCKAAKFATMTVEHTAANDKGFNSLSIWLRNDEYASSIQSIDVQYDIQQTDDHIWPVLQLPFLQLKQLKFLQVDRCHLKIWPAAAESSAILQSADRPTSAPQLTTTTTTTTAATAVSAVHGLRSLAALTTLNRLELDGTLLDLSELSKCTGLSCLSLCHVGHVEGDAADFQASAGPPHADQATSKNLPVQLADALPRLTKLLKLRIFYGVSKQQDQLASLVVSSISSLHHLRQLHLDNFGYEAADLNHLPTSITGLLLVKPPALTPHTVPRLLQLTELRTLHLMEASHIDAELLSAFTQLSVLSLRETKYDTATAVTELLTALQHLTLLRELNLNSSLCEECPVPYLYAALTVSSHLENLNLMGCKYLPGGIRYIFPDNSSGTSARLEVILTTADLFSSPGSFSNLVECCSNLRVLVVLQSIYRTIQLGNEQELSTMSRLTSLTSLAFWCVTLGDNAVTCIAACSSLRSLDLKLTADATTPVTVTGLMQLTQLTALTRLKLQLTVDDFHLEASLVTADTDQYHDTPPNVYMQFQQLLSHPAMLESPSPIRACPEP